MKTLFTISLFSLLLLANESHCMSYEYRGIYYYLNKETKEAEVTSHPEKYEGDIHIPSQVLNGYTVTSIGEEAFANCPDLCSVIIPNTVTIIKRHAFALSGILLENVSMPQSVRIIEDHAFYGCTSLKTIDLPAELISIDSEAFGDCSSLQTIYCYCKDIPQTKDDVFSYTDISQISLYVPEQSYQLYLSTEPWKSFKEIIPMSSTDIIISKDDHYTKKQNYYSINGFRLNRQKKGINIMFSEDGHTVKYLTNDNRR